MFSTNPNPPIIKILTVLYLILSFFQEWEIQGTSRDEFYNPIIPSRKTHVNATEKPERYHRKFLQFFNIKMSLKIESRN